MAKSDQKKQKRKQRKLRQRQAKKQKEIVRSASIEVPEPSAKIIRKLDEIFHWFEDGEAEHAIKLLKKLGKSASHSAAVAEAEFGIYQELGDRERASIAAKRFLKLVPQNPDAMFGYAQATLFCFRSSIALIQFKKFLDRWPDHDLAARAREAIEICDSESRRRVATANEDGGLELTFEDGGLEFYARHEESLEQMADHNLDEAIRLLEQNIKQQPQFISSRNNLVICRFYQGDLENAVRVAREICELAPDNRFAEANLIKIEFLAGNPEKANELADTAMVDPPEEQDSFTALVEALGYLGRDEDVIVLSQMLEQILPLDEDERSELLHCFAVANFRLDDKDEAERLWDECFDVNPHHPIALENRADIASQDGHAAWSQSLNKWLPQPFVMEMVKHYENDNSQLVGRLASGNPVVATIVPALLDRGDPAGREFALNFALADATPPMLAAVKDFAFSTRGPDELRNRALAALKEKSVIDVGPHRFFSRGQWTEIKLIGFEITAEPLEVELWKGELLEEGYWAMREGDLEIAEKAFQQVLDRDPNCRSARFNRASVWQRRRRGDEPEKAEREIRKLHADHPDYSFAAMAVAHFEAEEGNFDLSKQLIKDVVERSKLHLSEAMMLFTTQAQVALIEGDLEAAESSWNIMCQISNEDDPRVRQIREKIDVHRFRKTSGRGLADLMLGQN